MSLTQLTADVLCILKQKARIHPIEVHPINRGLLNEKWVVVTEKERWFVKSYSPERYARHVPNVWDEIARALELQQYISKLSSTCPRILPIDGTLLQTTPSGRRFVVMEYLHGSRITAGSANERQMFCLGRDTARMHQIWRDNNDLLPSISRGKPKWQVSKDAMLEMWEERWGARPERASRKVLETMQVQREIIESFHDEDV